jgi:N-acetylneuraminic acid mutarotase
MRILLASIASLAALSLSGPEAAIGAPWSTLAPLSIPRQEVAVAAVGGFVYVIGGFDSTAAIRNTVERYDPASDSWTTVASLPVVIHHATATAVNGKIYVIGGWSDFFATALDTVYEYDPGTDSWSAKTDMPSARGSPAATEVTGKIYVAGGWNAGVVDDFAVYDPLIDSWTVLPAMPTARNHFGAAGVGGKFYGVGGRTDLGAGAGNVATVELYDPIASSWSSVASLPRPRGGLAVSATTGLIFALGGEGNDDVPTGVFPDVDAYDPIADVWIPCDPMPTPRHGIGAAVVAARIHVPGGGPVEGFGVTGVHEILEVAPSVPALSGRLVALLIALFAGSAIARSRNARNTISPGQGSSRSPRNRG